MDLQLENVAIPIPNLYFHINKKYPLGMANR
jgi:hypothetical protein